jgi:hypothetical protein
MKYILTLLNGETRDILILDTPVYPCRIAGEGNTKFRTKKEIAQDPKRLKIVDENDPHWLFQDHVGYMRDEGGLFRYIKASEILLLNLTE